MNGKTMKTGNVMNGKWLRCADCLIKILCVWMCAGICLAACKKEVYAADEAQELTLDVQAANGESTARILDESYSTKITFLEDNPLTITAADGSDLYGIYVVWAAVPDEWTLTCDNTVYSCGKEGFLHEYIAIPDGTKSAELKLSNKAAICYIKGYSKGELPADVQVWKPVCDKADMLLLSSHADDEILFFGGILPEYAGERGLRVQVVYFSNYFGGTVIREHEKLDGLWHAGVRNYPVNGDFPDEYADNLEQAKQLYGYEETLAFVVEQIRRFKPQICIAQDENGEYGHGTHMLTAAAMEEAVGISMDSSRYPESEAQYGAWNVPKTYLHLYGENKIKLDCRKPLELFDGKTALEVAQESYKKHVSQQWCWFYVSDTYEYSIADFGLFRTTVGEDTGNDMMEHIVSYAEQEAKAQAEKERLEAEKESRKEAIRQSIEAAEKQSYEKAYGVSGEDVPEGKVADFLKTVGVSILVMIIATVVLMIIVAIVGMFNTERRNRKRRRKSERTPQRRRRRKK